jgi:hypothetical protein
VARCLAGQLVLGAGARSAPGLRAGRGWPSTGLRPGDEARARPGRGAQGGRGHAPTSTITSSASTRGLLAKLDGATSPSEPKKRVRCDVVVIGSGPGGAVAAKELAEAGRDVILLEEGPPFGPADFVQEAAEAMQRMLREGGTRAARGASFIPTMQAIALGGGSLVNSAICARSPDQVFRKWSDKSGTTVTRAELDPHYERVERFLWAEPTPPWRCRASATSSSSRAATRSASPASPRGATCAAARARASASPAAATARRSRPTSPTSPRPSRAGARVFTSVRAEQVTMRGRRATGVRGHGDRALHLARGPPVEIEAKCVVLAAGCIATPLLLQKSGVGNARWVGKDLQLHPGLAIMGVFPDVVDPWKGATQGYHSLHFLDEGIKLEVLWSPLGARRALPGLGHDYQKHLSTTPHGPVRRHHRGRSLGRHGAPARGGWDPDIEFAGTQDDVDLIQRGIGILSDICWAAGATHDPPRPPRRPRDPAIEGGGRDPPYRRSCAAPTRSPPRTTRSAPRACPVARGRRGRRGGRCHDADNLYVADTGIFPGSPAVNPMLTVHGARRPRSRSASQRGGSLELVGSSAHPR